MGFIESTGVSVSAKNLKQDVIGYECSYLCEYLCSKVWNQSKKVESQSDVSVEASSASQSQGILL